MASGYEKTARDVDPDCPWDEARPPIGPGWLSVALRAVVNWRNSGPDTRKRIEGRKRHPNTDTLDLKMSVKIAAGQVCDGAAIAVERTTRAASSGDSR